MLEYGGYALVHDYGVFPGVTQFCDELDQEPVERADSTVVYQKHVDAV